MNKYKEIIHSFHSESDQILVKEYLKDMCAVFIKVSNDTGEPRLAIEFKGKDFWLTSFDPNKKGLKQAQNLCIELRLPFSLEQSAKSLEK